MFLEFIDTAGLLDRCECGSNGIFKYNCDYKIDQHWRAQCMECANATEWYIHHPDAMIAWNKMMRSLQKEISEKSDKILKDYLWNFDKNGL